MLSSVLLFFDIGGGEILLIMLVALLLFGGEKLPELARGLGKGIRDFKDASEGVKREITNQIDNFEAKKAEQQAAAKTPDKPADEINSDTALPTDHVQNTMPVAEIGSAAAIEPAKAEADTPGEAAHLKETVIDPQTEAPAKTEHEIKS